jgi:hypothetical protein
MDYVTRQFINLTKKFRKELRLQIFKLNGALDKQTKAIREAAKSNQVEQSPQPEVTTVVNIPERIEVRQSAEDTEHDRRYKNRSLLLSFVTFWAIAIYAVLVYLQYREMINATGVTQAAVNEARHNRLQGERAMIAELEQSRLDQRAWIGINNVVGAPKLNDVWKVEVVFHNSGRTPARSIRGSVLSEGVSRGKEPTFVYSKARSFEGGMIPPNGDFHTTVTISHDTNTQKPAPVDQPILDSLSSGDAKLYIHGEFQYGDIFGCRHWITFCWFYMTEPSGFGACRAHNDTGDYECKK